MRVSSTNFYGTFLILRRFKPDITITVHRSSCKVPVILEQFLSNLNSFSKNIQIQNLMKFRPVGAEFFHEGGRAETDRHDKANLKIFERI